MAHTPDKAGKAGATPTIPDPHAEVRVRRAGPPPERAAGGVVLLLHGRGRTAESMFGLAASLGRPDVAYLAPQAAGQSWYPHRFIAPIGTNEPALTSAIGALDRMFANLGERGIGPERVVLVGFSQGACLASEYVARRPRRYGGLSAIIGGLFGPPDQVFTHTGSLEDTPALLCSADPDPFVPPERVLQTAAVFDRMGAVVTVRILKGVAHVVPDEAIAGTQALLDRLGPPSSPVSARAPGRRRGRVPGRPKRTHPTGL